MGLDDKVQPEGQRNENLLGEKSTQVHPEEAQEEKMVAKQKGKQIADRQPDEVKSTTPLLKEDAEQKAENSCEGATG